MTTNNDCLLTDHYQLTMSAAYYTKKLTDKNATFSLFVRKLPENRNFLVAAGLEQALDYLENLHFEKEHIDWLSKRPEFAHADKTFFTEYLPNFKFSGAVRAVSEGTPIFPNEPILEVTAPIIEAQLVESMLLSTFAGQTMVASKAARIVHAAQKRPVTDFGLRRAHEPHAGLYGARAAYLAGCAATSNDLAGFLWGIPVTGTMAHSYIQTYGDEKKAFADYAEVYPDFMVALIDTYNPIAGAINASELGELLKAVRIDSGDLAKNARNVRRALDKHGLKDTKIVASSDLNEYKIEELVASKYSQNRGPIDLFGVGTELMVSKDAPSLGIVYKLVEFDNKPRIKLSEGKVTYPGRKQIYRIYDGQNSHDILALEDEVLEGTPLLHDVMTDGKRIDTQKSVHKIRDYCLKQQEKLPSHILCLKKTEPYKVRVSPQLEKLTNKLSLDYHVSVFNPTRFRGITHYPCIGGRWRTRTHWDSLYER
ncbi:nicotinate phosphoribosyltransferase [archaeon CG10_big_fil_rev_8_21_14_0_10_43_11]|nr:MAG: nicotinate phosphoribosyltransferase [archaeon CG10_big_fil_rev_8_21_14_0_10_43_11]